MSFLVAHGSALLFYLFAGLVLAGAAGVVTLRNPMYGALSLLGAFLGVAALFLLRHAEFVGLVQIFVYGGGVMVLFLFVIMLVNLHRLQESRMFASTAPLAAVVGALLVGLIVWALAQAPRAVPTVAASASLRSIAGATAGNSEAVAWVLFKDYLVPFEIASVFLLVAMIGAVVLGRKG